MKVLASGGGVVFIVEGSGTMLSGCVTGVSFASECPLTSMGFLPCLVETVVLVCGVSRPRGLLLRQDRDPFRGLFVTLEFKRSCFK